MSITRRALLGSLIGLPLGVKVAEAAVPSTHGIDIQRVHDVADMTCYDLIRQLHRDSIQRSDTPQPQGSDYLYIVVEIPFEVFECKFDSILANYLLPYNSVFSERLKKEYEGEATWCGVQCIRATEIGFLYATLVAQTAEAPIYPSPHNLYDAWREVILI